MADLERDHRTDTFFVDDIIERVPVTAFQIRVVMLCVLTAMVEGYDIQAMAFAAPLIAKAWDLQTSALGPVLTASIVGLAVGATLFAPLGDRSGRRPCILFGLVITALMTALGAIAQDLATLVTLRFLAGAGLGLTIPNMSAIALEFLPRRRRVIAIVSIGCGYPLGAALGGAIAGELSLLHGWSAVFVVGGIATLASALACLAMPESPFLLAGKPSRWTQLARIMSRIERNAEAYAAPEGMRFAIHEQPVERSPVRALFAPEHRATTLLLWMVYFANMAMMYFFISWLPSLFTHHGLGVQAAIRAAATFSAGGVIGGLALAFMLGHQGPLRVLGPTYAAAAASIIVLGAMTGVGPVFLGLVFLAGAFIVGSQFCLSAIVTQYYPTAMRVTGAGFANGAGRLGAIAAPLAGGALLAVSPDMQRTFMIASVPAVLAVGAVVLLAREGRLAGIVSARG